MKRKTSVFASNGALDPALTDSDFTTGMIAGTVAKAEDVNTYGNKSDEQLKIVSDEICNAITDQGISLESNDSAQLSKVLKQKIGNGVLLTGIVYESYQAPGPTLSNGVLTFPKFTVQFNKKVFYGTKQVDFQTVEVQQQTMSATSGWADGVYFVYVDNSGVIKKQDSPVLAADGATKCYLGSFFVDAGKIQDGSWSYEPWLQQSSMAIRTMPTAQTKGGLVLPLDATRLKIGALQVSDEGINFAQNQLDPNIKNFPAASPMEYKFLYIGYVPSAASETTLDTTHLYNMTDGTWDDISGKQGFVVMVPCVTPTGQVLLIPPMSEKTGETYKNIFATQKAAENAVFGLQYSLGNVADRVIYLGQSIIVKVGADNLLDPEQFEVYGVVPQSLAGFTNQGGQSGGGTGGFVPMLEETKSGSSINLSNQTSNIIEGSSEYDINVFFPEPQPRVLNQLEIKYKPNASRVPGISFQGGIKWWDNDTPIIEANTVYSFIFEYNRSLNSWVGGTLSLEV